MKNSKKCILISFFSLVTLFVGIGSTWNVDGMEQMSTEEYYKAINQRNHEIKALRKKSATYEREPVNGYLNSLNKKANGKS